MIGVRVIDGEFHGQCAQCVEYWPLTLQFWCPAWGMRRCMACVKESRSDATRRWLARRVSDPRARRDVQDANRRSYARNREGRLARRRARHAVKAVS